MRTIDGSTAANILTAALGHMRDRAATYDKPEGERSMGATVDAFQAVTGVSMTEEQGWLFMALLKAVRSQQGAYRADSYEDGAAYFALAGEAAVRDRNGGWTDKAIKAAALHAHPATFDHIDPADVEISEQSAKCKGCYAGCRDCCPGLAKIADEKLAKMRAASAERFVNECVGFLSEPASAIDDDSERMQAIGQNGEMASEVYAAVDGAPSWNDAPAWAQWLAQDIGGRWYWFECPIYADSDDEEWYEQKGFNGGVEIAGESEERNENWSKTMQARPVK